MKNAALTPCRIGRPPLLRKRGFTLVEIMVTVGVLGILASFSFLNARVVQDRLKADMASSKLTFHLQKTRSMAIARNQNVFVRILPEQNRFRYWLDEDRNGTVESSEITSIVLADIGPVTVTSTWTNGLFNAYGQFITTPGQREMKTVSTVFTSAGGDREVELILRGSGAVTKR